MKIQPVITNYTRMGWFGESVLVYDEDGKCIALSCCSAPSLDEALKNSPYHAREKHQEYPGATIEPVQIVDSDYIHPLYE